MKTNTLDRRTHQQERIHQLMAEVDAMKSYGRFPEHLGVRRSARLSEIIDELEGLALGGARTGTLHGLARERDLKVADDRALKAERKAQKAEAATEVQRRRADRAERLAELRSLKALNEAASISEADFTLLPRGFYVYYLWGEDADVPLYVGMSKSLPQRLASHINHPARHRSIKAITVRQCESEASMRAFELAEIRRFRPAWNIVGKPQ